MLRNKATLWCVAASKPQALGMVWKISHPQAPQGAACTASLEAATRPTTKSLLTINHLLDFYLDLELFSRYLYFPY